MEQSELISIWKSYDRKLEKALQLNNRYAADLLKLKTQSALSSMNPIKLLAIVVGCIWVIAGGTIVVNIFRYEQASPFFLYSAAFQLLVTAIAIVIYACQLVLIRTIDVSDPVVRVQQKLTWLKGSTLWVARILLLQLPAWTTFYLSGNLIRQGNPAYLLANGAVTLLFTFAAGWLFFNIRYENKDKTWFKWLFRGKEWTPIMESIGLYQEIADFESESTN